MYYPTYKLYVGNMLYACCGRSAAGTGHGPVSDRS
jgi:hypothetical protein